MRPTPRAPRPTAKAGRAVQAAGVVRLGQLDGGIEVLDDPRDPHG